MAKKVEIVAGNKAQFELKTFSKEKNNKITVTIGPKFEKILENKPENAEIYQNSSKHAYFQPKKSKKWPVERFEMKNRFSNGMGLGGVIDPNIS